MDDADDASASPLDPPPEGSDDRTAEEFIAGDEVAFAELYRRYARPIHDYALGITRDRVLAEDITQTVFLRAYEQRSTVRDPAAVRAWLYRIAHNTAINQVTRTMPTHEITEDAPIAASGYGPAELAEQDDSVRLVWDAAASLEPRQYAVLDLALRKGLTSSEIAQVLGLEPAAASLALNRAREALGNAVRYLLVARRRRHCERLSELVPDGVRTLSPEQRATVDRHLRRCENCQRTASALTAPGELFAAIPPVALPVALVEWSGHTAHPAANSSRRRGSRGGRGRLVTGHPVLAALGAAMVIAALAITVVATRPAGHPSAQAGPTIRPTTAPPTTSSGPTPVSTPSFAAAARFTAPTAMGANTYYSASCPSDSTCYAVGLDAAQHPILTTTTNGGQDWTTVRVAVPSALGLLDCPSVSHCVAARANGSEDTFMVTEDSGRTWRPASTPRLADLLSVSCPTDTGCIVVGGLTNSGGTREAAATTDGGHTWHPLHLPGPAGDVDCVDQAHCWATGIGAAVWSSGDFGRTWTTLDPPTGNMPVTGESRGPYPANSHAPLQGLGFYADGVEFTSENDGFVFGGGRCGGYHVTKCPSGLYRTTDGGRTWTFWTFADEARYGDGSSAQCTPAGCLLIADTFTRSVLLTSPDGVNWTDRQTFPSYVGRPACTPSGTTCVLLGRTGLYLAST
jgi:RNA polymerase sigma factor (sigma-70 family)